LNIVGGLDRPTTGRVWFHESDMAKANKRQLTEYRRWAVGFVFQLYNLIPDLTARENVMVAAELCDKPMNVEEALGLVGLEERMDHFPSQMSGGEQQRVAIARALVKNPEALLCDEPTGALDYSTGKKVLSLLVDLNKRLGKTVMIVTHNSSISQIANRVIRMRSGSIVELQTNPHPLPPSEITW
jgi:putative ABC transport system ATP-binding protein